MLTVTWKAVEGGNVKAYKIKGGPGGEVITNKESADFLGVKPGEVINFEAATQFFAGSKSTGVSTELGTVSAYAKQPLTVRKLTKRKKCVPEM